MKHRIEQAPSRRTVGSRAVSTALLLMGAQLAHAQQPAADSDVTQVLVVGARAAEKSSIERKKNANTAMDSIVADDVGSFPDRNVAEAISRIAGVALERGEFGEGNSVNVRGNGPDLTRVEIDGMGVMAGGGTDLNGGGEGRGVELRELPADLIASVDVVKGSTADMTEGSLGGGIIIKTRTGLDFKKRTISLRASGQMNTLNDKWTPNLNLIFADKFLDGRLGMVANLSKSRALNESHSMQIGANNSGYLRDIDFDQSPEKTFALNPAALSPVDPLVNEPFTTYPTTSGGTLATLSPAEIVRRAAAAKSKDECMTAFPWYSAAELAPLSAANRAAAQNTRAGELRSCLYQWNDYLPGNTRYFVKTQEDDRTNADVRFDFKVNSKLTVYAKFNRSDRKIVDVTQAFGLGSPTIASSGFADSAATFPNIATRTASAAGQYVFPGTLVNRGISGNNYLGMTNGVVANILPASVKVDANHHVTELTLTGGGANNDVISSTIETNTRTQQFGGTFRDGRLRAEFLFGRTKADFFRYGLRSNLGFSYGNVTMKATPDGLWEYEFPGANPLENLSNLNLYGVLAPNADPKIASRGPSTQLTFDNPKMSESNEDNLKIDLSYAVGHQLPWLRNVKAGINRRDFGSTSWGGGGYTVTPAANGQPAVVVPTLAIRSSFQACGDTPASLAPGGTPCPYGVSYSTSASTPFNSSTILTQEQYRKIVEASLQGRTSPFFDGARLRPADMTGWVTFDTAKAFEMVGVKNMNLDCIKECAANDGKVYEQPRSQLSETVSAGYISTDFEVDDVFGRALPWGMELSGNFGWRYVRTDVNGTGMLTFRAIRKAPTYEVDGATITTSVSRNTTFTRRTTDIMPVLNLALWAVPDEVVLRYNRGKTIARPPASRLVSGGITCTYDETQLPGTGQIDQDDDSLADMSCGGVMGNPGLRAQTNVNQNLSVEWYPNADSVLSLSLFKQKGVIGANQRARLDNQRPFAGTGAVDPGTGQALGEVQYSYLTYLDGPPNKRNGIELSGKTAFTFLPSYLRYTGLSANISRVKSTNLDGQIVELATGEALPPFGEMEYNWNTSLWYDDGALNMRAALQVNAWSVSRFQVLSNSFPAVGWIGTTALPYLPSHPQVRDSRRFVDLRVGYKFKNGIEIFAEGRNLGKTSIGNSNGAYGQFAGNRARIDMGYSGVRYMAGIVLRN